MRSLARACDHSLVHAITRFLFVVAFLICSSLALPAFAQPAQPAPSESGLSSNDQRFVSDLLMVTNDPASGWCAVDFMSTHPITRSICNFDIGKLQTVPSIKTPGAVVYPMIFTHSILDEQTVRHFVEDGQRDQTGRMTDWPPLDKLTAPDGPPAFVFSDWDGRLIEKPEPDLVLFMRACADYVARNEAKIDADWRELQVAREQWARQAAIEAAKPKLPSRPPVFLKLEWEPGSGIPGVFRSSAGEATGAAPATPVKDLAQ